MPELIIGCGGWQYFLIPGVDSLEIYSQAFRFVEVNSTFYTLPNHDLDKSSQIPFNALIQVEPLIMGYE